MLRISSPCRRHGIEFAINVSTSWTRSFLLLRIHYVHGIEFAIVVPATQKPFERVLVATFMLRIFSFSASHGVEYDNSTLYRFKRSLRLAIQNTNDCSWPGFKATW